MTNDSKACIACAEDIKANAKLCKHCGVMQDDERFAADKPLETPNTSTPTQTVECPTYYCKNTSCLPGETCPDCGAILIDTSGKAEEARYGNCSNCGNTHERFGQPCSYCKIIVTEKVETRLGDLIPASPRNPIPRVPLNQTLPVTSSDKKVPGVVMVLGVVILLIIIALASGSNRGGIQNTNIGTNYTNTDTGTDNTVTGHYQNVCQQVWVPRTDISAYQALKLGVPSGSFEQQCNQVWVDDSTGGHD